MTIVIDEMSQKVFKIRPDYTVFQATKIMSEKNISCLIIVDKDILGIITERDVSKKVVAKGLDPNKVLVKSVMSNKIISVSPFATVEAARRLMEKYKVRHLPVVDEDELVGIITTSDI